MPTLALAKALSRKKLSKRQFAKRLGMEYRAVFQLFRPEANPTFKSLCRWAHALECRVRDLIEED